MDNVQEQINNELLKFQTETYNGKVEIPSDILEYFKKGILSLPPQVHGLSAHKIKAIYTRKPKEITNGELQDIIRIIFNASFDKMYEGEDFIKALDKHIALEKFILSYHNEVDDFQAKMKMKRATLQSLTRGVGSNGMKIIN